MLADQGRIPPPGVDVMVCGAVARSYTQKEDAQCYRIA